MFQNIAKTMGTILNSRKELRDTILVSLRKLIHSVSKNDDSSNDKEQLAYFAKNFLPICLNLYTYPAHGTDEEATRFSALETIKVNNIRFKNFFCTFIHKIVQCRYI